jgi:pimeloyl-ACP methyl ester carboxylesterase
MERVEIDGLSIAFERSGHGPTLLLLHGILGDSRMWRRQFEGLSSDFTVVAWDAPGCGRSADPPESLRMPGFARLLVRFIEELGLERPAVLGLSWGAVLALQLCETAPDVPASLILASGYAGWAGSLPADVVAARLAQARRESDLPPEAFVPGWIPGLLTDRAPTTMVSDVTANMSGFHPAGYRSMAEAVAAADLRSVLPPIRVPTLVLHGELDRRSPVPVAERLHDQIPGSVLVVMPGVGHLANVEVPDRFDAEVQAFLRSQGGPA